MRATPTVIGRPTSSRTRRRSRAAICAGVPAIRLMPLTSMNASSIDRPSTAGDMSSKTRYTALLASLYAEKRGGTTIAPGQRRPRPPPAHGRLDAVRLRLVARGQHDSSADDDRPALEAKIVPLLDRGVERIQVGVEDRRLAHEHMFAEGPRLDIYRYRNIWSLHMARAATTTDAFNAVAEPRRRQILDVLAGGERPVNELASTLRVAQPLVSKHLRVLREVGVVAVREDGRRRLYRLNGPALKPIHDWVKNYERSWSERFERLDAVLEELKEKEEGDEDGK